MVVERGSRAIELSPLEARVRRKNLERIEDWDRAVIREKSDGNMYDPRYVTFSCVVNVEGISEAPAELGVTTIIQSATLQIKTEALEDFLPGAAFVRREGLEPEMIWRWGVWPETRKPQQVEISRRPKRIDPRRGYPDWIAAEFAGALERLTAGQVKVTPRIA